jgi:ferrous iron transport protein A
MNPSSTIADRAAATAEPAAGAVACRLADLPAHRPGRVIGLEAGAGAEAEDLALRLSELGFLAGEAVEVVARAAFGGPLAVRIGTATFALRRSEAAAVRVRHGP